MSTTDDILGEWRYDYFGGAAYGMQVEWATETDASESDGGDGGGGGGTLLRRERPKLLFDETGQPAWLFNGVGLELADGTLGPGARNTFTFAQHILPRRVG